MVHLEFSKKDLLEICYTASNMQSENLETLHSLSFLLWIVFAIGGIFAWAHSVNVLGFNVFPYREYAFPLFFGCIVFIIIALVTVKCGKEAKIKSKESPIGIVYCKYCGTRTDADALFCKKCGKEL